MSRIPKWKVEKAKVKAVFRLQLHATHIPQPGWDKLFVSFIPADTGKATAKTTKANVRNGNCKWSDPIYETTRLLLDTRNRKYEEKLYKLVVAMGSSRSSLLGEVTINLSDFADASKPSCVALPLHSCDYGTVLHVTVQLLTSKTGFREFEQQRELSVKGFQTLSGQISHNPGEAAAASLEMGSEQRDKGNARVRLKENSVELPLLEEVEEPNEYYEDSAAGIDGSSNTSESLYTEKNEISSIHEVESLKSTASGDMSALVAGQSPRIVKGDVRDLRLSKQGSNDWTHGWSTDYSADNDLITAHEDNNRLRVRLEGVESAFLQLKTEAESLHRLSDELGAETHSLAEQLVMELASGEKLTREVSILKSECVKFKTELDELKSATAMQCFPGNRQVVDALSKKQDSFSSQHQIKWLQGLLLLEDKIREIQSKACLAYHGSDSNFINSDFDVLHCILLNLKQETSLELEEETQLKEMQPKLVSQSNHFIHKQDMEGSYIGHHHDHPEAILQGSINSHPLKKNIDAAGILEEKMCEILQKLEESNAEKEILTKKMNQMECYYEALIQELEESRHQAVNELEHIRTEHSSCLYTISALQSQVEKLQQDMSGQLIRFAGDRHDLESLNEELEKRAIVSETALKRVRLNYAVAVDRLQKDLEVLSFQILSMYETNENLAKQALIDVSQVIPHQYPENNPDDKYKSGIAKFQSERMSRKIDCEKSTVVNGVSNQASHGTVRNFNFSPENTDIFPRGLPKNIDLWTKDEGNTCMNGLKIENIESSSQLKSIQQGKCCNCSKKLQLDTEAEFSEMYMLNMHWEVFTQVLKEAMYHVDDGVLHTKEEIVKLTQQLELSTSEESLMLKLHSAFDDVKKLRKDEANCRSKCDDLMMKNHILEAKFEDGLEENNSLIQKVAEYESKYKSCRSKCDDLMMKNHILEAKIEDGLEENNSLIQKVSEYESKYKSSRSKCDDLMMKNHILEAKIEDGLEENNSLIQKFAEYERLESKYKSCLEERNEFEDMLKNESLQRSCLQSEIRSTIEDLKALKEEYDNLSSANSELQRTINHLQKKFGDLCHSMVSFSEEIDVSTFDGLSLKQEMESNNYMAIVLHLEEFQKEACKKILQLRQEKKEIEKDRDIAYSSLNKTESQILHLKQKFESDLEESRTKLDLSNALAEKLQLELQDVADKLKFSLEAVEKQISTNRELSSKLTILEIEIQQANDENMDLAQNLLEFDNVKEELESSNISLMKCMQENRTLMMSIESGQVVSAQLENELSNLKESLRCAHDNLHSERELREELEATVADLTLKLKEKDQLLEFDNVKEELEKSNLSLMDCMRENRALMMSIELGQVVSIQLENELSILKESLKCAHDNLHSERESREELEATVADLTLQLKEKDQKLLMCDEQKSELIILRKRVIDLETEMQHCLFSAEECKRKYDDVVSTLKLQIADLEYNFDLSLSSDIKLTYLRCQLHLKMEELVNLIKAMKGEFEELHLKHAGVVASLNDRIATEEQFTEENVRLSTALQSVNAELEVVVREKEDLIGYIDEKSSVLADLEDMKARAAMLEADNCRERHRYEDEICQLRNMLVSLEEEVEHLRSSKVELETTVIIFKSKLDEQQAHISLLEECELELKRLREQHNELSYKLSEQILKTEEFKNLSIHLRELKDKADAECIQARERRESEGSSAAMQDSLRIAFIKEQCESKLQEMKSQLCASKKYAEEMLLKLQTALDEVETGKRSEASLAKRNEELSMKISDMETELQTVVSDRRELVKTCDRMKAELECTTLSLDCCKEEKLKLEASEKECNEERTRLRVELDLVKRLLDNMVSSSADVEVQKSQPGCHISSSIGEILEDENSQSKFHQETPNAACSGEGTVTMIDKDPVNSIDRVQFLDVSPVVSSSREVKHVLPACDGVNSLPTLQPDSSSNLEDAVVTRSLIDKEKLLENSRKHIADIKEHFKGQQQLRTSMDLLHKELERLKNDNLSSVIPLEDYRLDSALQDLQSDLSQLAKANEHLGSIFPSFKELPGSGNALERVLALELELAEALQAKKTDIRFQSSFLKQHNDDEAVFQSFRDINELLKDMLDLKRRNAAVETELKEMQGRYSQLSLQFAEVEGERQQLVMSLKSRSPRKS